MDFNRLTLGDKILGIAGILLLITLIVLPWHSVDIPRIRVGEGSFGGGSIDRTAMESPNSFWGVLAFLLTLAVLAVLIIRRLTSAKLPDLPVGWNQALFYGSIAVLALLLLKLVMETEALGFGCYLAILLAAAMVYGGFLISKQSETDAGDLSTN